MLANRSKSQKRSGDSSLSSNNTSTKKRRRSGRGSKSMDDGSLLAETLKTHGLYLQSGENPHLLNTDQAVFLKSFTKDVSTHMYFPNNIDEMLATLFQYLEDRIMLANCLASTRTSPECDTARSEFQDSLIRLLLCVPDMQKKLLDHLLDILADVSNSNNDVPTTQRSQSNNQLPLPHRILSSIRFLPMLKDNRGVAEKLLEMLATCPLDVQKEIIFSLPQIVNDSQHERIGVALKDILCESKNLTCTVLDTLTSITISREIMKDILNTVLKRLDRFDIEDLPSVVEFVLSSIQNSEDALHILQELRDNLDLSPPPSTKTDLRSQNKTKQTKDIQCIIMETIHLQSLISKHMADAWLKIIDSCQELDLQKSLDIHILVALADNVAKKKMVENIFKNKIRKGLFTEELFKNAITIYSSIIKKYFNNFINICDMLLRSPEVGISNFASYMYIQAFVTFSSTDMSYQQEIVGDLISKVGTGGGGSITDGALRTLEKLAEQHSDKLVAYTPFITAMMDFTDYMSLSQFRQLMSVLCNLAWYNSGDDEDDNKSSLQNEVNIMMRKQLTSKSPILKKRGVIAAVCAVRAMAKKFGKVTTDSLSKADMTAGGSGGHPNNEIEKAVKKLIDSAIRETRLDPEASGLFMDELASPLLLKDLPLSIAKTCSEKFQTSFEADFVEDYSENKSERDDLLLPIKQMFKIEEEVTESSGSLEDGGEITLPISKWVLQNKQNPLNHKTEMNRFIPHFRLMASITSYAEEEEIDALLGCGILVVPESYLNNEETMNQWELEALTDILFFCVNWFREVINFFINSEEEITHKQVLVRIKNIRFIEEKLKVHLSTSLNYRPPTVLFSEDTSDWQPLNNQEKNKKGKTGGKGKGGKGKKGKGKKNETESEAMNGTVHITTQVTQPGTAGNGGPVASSTMIGHQSILKPDAAKTAGVDLTHYRPFLRELDLDLLKIFNYFLVDTKSEPEYDEEKKDPKLRPADLMFLLKDVASKVDKKLVGKKKAGFPGLGSSASACGYTNLMAMDEKSVASCLAKFLPKLFANLDVLKGHFQNLIKINDGIMDSANLYTPACQLYSQCIKQGFDIATSLFSWNGFHSSDNEIILMECLKKLVERVDGDIPADINISQLAVKTVNYLLSFKENIVCCEVGSSHLALLDALAKVENGVLIKKQVSETAGSYAQRNWQNSDGKDKGAVFNAQVIKFWTYYLDNSEEPTTLILNIFNSGVQDVFENKAKDYYNEAYPTLTRASLHTLYQVALQKLSAEIKDKTYGVTKDKDDLLEMWTQTTDIILKAVNPLKVWRNRPILKAVLKYSKPCIDYFLKNGMPLLENIFKRKSMECLNVIKTLQASTRYLHVICTSTKMDSDLALANYVPMLKKSLEATVYRVQAMLAANNYGDAFWMGNLKNRDLAGEEILSQVAGDDDEDGEGDVGEEEDLEDEDNPEDEVEVNGAEDPDSIKYDDDDD